MRVHAPAALALPVGYVGSRLIASLLYGMAIELGPWWCPLTLLEQALLDRAGVVPYHEGFVIHYLQAVVYPDLSPVLLTWAGVAVCAFNLGVYARRWRRGGVSEK